MDDPGDQNVIKKRKRRRNSCRQPQLDWNQFIVDWNQLYLTGADIKTATQFFGATHCCLAVRLGTCAKSGIYLPRLRGMTGFKNRRWKKAEARIRKGGPAKPAKMLADMASSGMMFRLLPVAAG